MRAVDTPIGKVVVLPHPCHWQDCPHGADCTHAVTIGDTEYVDEECPTCEGTGVRLTPGGLGGLISIEVRCQTCFGERAIAVRYVVREVLPIISEDRWHDPNPPLPCVIVTWAGPIMYAPLHLNEHVLSLDLPDAQPGGVLLVVERAE